MDPLRDKRIAIVSRIFAPEPGAASLRLRALAQGMRRAGASTVVITTRPPRGYQPDEIDDQVDVRRAPVLRDSAGYVRGYLQYLSFDLPAFFRVLLGGRLDALIVEPPPTTGVMMRVAAAVRRIPYYFYAADVWSEAAAIAGAPSIVVGMVRAFERFTYRRATAVFAVSESVAARVRESCPSADVIMIGNGFDADVFTSDGPSRELPRPYLVYAGTASEVHGARIFVEALPDVLEKVDAEIVFVGQGTDRDEIERLAERLAPGRVRMLPRCSPAEAAEWLRGARASLASMRPDGYEAFPTKMYASIGCGTPVIFAGDGEGRAFLQGRPDLGWVASYDPSAVASAMIEALQARPDGQKAAARSTWARTQHDLGSAASAIVSALTR